jgi:hypothetical protein
MSEIIGMSRQKFNVTLIGAYKKTFNLAIKLQAVGGNYAKMKISHFTSP